MTSAGKPLASDPAASAKDTAPEKRRPGRPKLGQASPMTRARILRTALKMTKTIALQDLSIVLVAKKMNVTPALVHYYIGSRDWLTSGVMNLFYRDLIKKWPQRTGVWKKDIISAAHVIYTQFVDFPGIAAYAVSNSKFRVFQMVEFGERDYGAEVLEMFTSIIQSVGLSGPRTGIYSSQFMEFLFSISHGASHHIFPAEHKSFLQEKLASLDAEKYPSLLFSQGGPLAIDGELAFAEGCYLYLIGMETELNGTPTSEKAGVSMKDII
jgi:AcrR family transcriptional regulator